MRSTDSCSTGIRARPTRCATSTPCLPSAASRWTRSSVWLPTGTRSLPACASAPSPRVVDDSEEAIRHRQDVYLRETEPLISIYRSRGLLIEVDGLGSVDEVGERISTALAERGIRPVENDRAVG